MASKSKEPRKSRFSLRERQRRYVFLRQSKFEPVRVEDFCEVACVLPALKEIIDHLKHFREYSSMGVELPSAAIFYGFAGTGKTYGARLVATQIGSEFVDVRGFPRHPDEDAFSSEDVRQLFALAERRVRKIRGTVLLFWDQFDAFLESAGQEAISQFYVELDGVLGKRRGVFLIAATSKDIQDEDSDEDSDEMFDEQLLQRFGVKVHFMYPTKKQQARLLQYHLDRKPHAPIDCDSLVHTVTDLGPRIIRDLVNEAYLGACRRARRAPEEGAAGGRIEILEGDLLQVLMNYLQGSSHANDRTPQEMERLAIHEVGHMAVAWELGQPVFMVSLVPADNQAGRTVTGFSFERDEDIQDLKNALAVNLGGYSAEKFFGFSSTMTCQDLEVATEKARELVTELGRGLLLNAFYGRMTVKSIGALPLSPQLLAATELDMGAILQEQESRALAILKRFGRRRILHVAHAILRKDPPIMLRRELDKLRQEAWDIFSKEAETIFLESRDVVKIDGSWAQICAVDSGGILKVRGLDGLWYGEVNLREYDVRPYRPRIKVGDVRAELTDIEFANIHWGKDDPDFLKNETVIFGEFSRK